MNSIQLKNEKIVSDEEMVDMFGEGGAEEVKEFYGGFND